MKDEDILRKYVAEAVGRIAPSYLKKEAVRQGLQDLLEAAVASGEVSSDEGLSDWWATIDMASKALRAVPLAAWKKKTEVR